MFQRLDNVNFNRGWFSEKNWNLHKRNYATTGSYTPLEIPDGLGPWTIKNIK